MSKIIHRKFPFFDVEEGNREMNMDDNDLKKCETKEIKACDDYIFISVKENNKEKIIKLKKNKKFGEFECFTHSINKFIIKKKDTEKNSERFLFIFGVDSLKKNISNNQNENEISTSNNENTTLISSLKIYDITECISNDQTPNELFTIILRYKEEKNGISISNSDSDDKSLNSFLNVSNFDVSDDMMNCAFTSNNNNDLIVISSTNINNDLTKIKDLKSIKIQIVKRNDFENEEEDVKNLDNKMFPEITNIGFSVDINNNNVLYYSTKKGVYYLFLNDLNVKMVEFADGAVKNCFTLGKEENKFFIEITANENECLKEFINFDQGLSICLEGKKKYLFYFKKYYGYILDEENINTLAIYDSSNDMFVCYNSSLGKIKGFDIENNYIYILGETNDKKKIVFKLKEKDNKEKFDSFYKKGLYDTAFKYAINLNYDDKKKSEISLRHAKYLYEKGEYEKSIEQYVNTINYQDPSYVIQKFLEGSKLDFLIKYLEKLLDNETFKKTCDSEQLKDYTALLLNCYIKQKQTQKLKKFVDDKKLNDPISIKTAIEVCKDTKEYDLALTIAKNAQMTEAYIQILMDLKGDYIESLEYLKGVKNIVAKYNLLLKYGEKFLEKEASQTSDVITNLVTDIIHIKNFEMDKISNLSDIQKRQIVELPNEKLKTIPELKVTDEKILNLSPNEIKAIQEIKYDKIINIFVVKDGDFYEQKENSPRNMLIKLLNLMMENDNKCPCSIAVRRIELYVDELVNLNQSTSGISIFDEMNKIFENPKFKEIDKSYILMLFKVTKFNLGVEKLTEIMKLNDELCQIYMDNHEYPKLLEFCKRKKNEQNGRNFIIQALCYLIHTSQEATKNYIGPYIKQILDLIKGDDGFNPMLLLQIIGKEREDSINNKVLEFKYAKNYIMEWLINQQEQLNEDRKICLSNVDKIQKTNNQIEELKTKAKMFSMSKCLICKSQVKPPFVFFACNHACCSECTKYSYDEEEEVSCPVCQKEERTLLDRIEQTKAIAKDQNSFFTELKGKAKKFNLFAEFLGKGIFNYLEKDDEKNNKM